LDAKLNNINLLLKEKIRSKKNAYIINPASSQFRKGFIAL